MAETVEVTNKFELVILAGERARQLLKGCTPRTQGSDKAPRLATLEVKQGHIRKVDGEK
jgi:DNA-directed RNA polymerase subunit K/omega